MGNCRYPIPQDDLFVDLDPIRESPNQGGNRRVQRQWNHSDAGQRGVAACLLLIGGETGMETKRKRSLPAGIDVQAALLAPAESAFGTLKNRPTDDRDIEFCRRLKKCVAAFALTPAMAIHKSFLFITLR